MNENEKQGQLNHNIRKRFNELIYNVARYTEIVLSVIILVVIAFAGVRLVCEVLKTNVWDMDSSFFSTFLAAGLSLVVGVEFVKMLCQHSTKTVLEVLMFATARQMVVEHLSTLETLIGVVAIAVLFAVRRFLMTTDDDMGRGEKNQEDLEADEV